MNRSRGGARRAGGVGKKNSAPAPEWSNLMGCGLLLCQIAGDENPDTNEIVQEPAAMFSQAKRQKMPAQERLEILDGFGNLVSDFLPEVAEFPAAKAKEVQFDVLLKDLFTHTIAYYEHILKTVDSSDGDEGSVEAQEAGVTLRLLDQIIAGSLAQSPGQKLNCEIFQPMYAKVVDLALSTAEDDKYEQFLRESAIGLLGNLIEVHPAGAVKDGAEIVSKIIDKCFQFASNPDDRELNPDKFSTHNLATQTFDVLVREINIEACKTGGVELKETHNPAFLVFNQAKIYLTDAQASEDQKKAGLIALAVLPEAAPAFTKPRLPEIMGFLKANYASPSELIRSAALISSAEYFEELNPEVGEYRAAFLSELLKILGSTTESEQVRVRAAQPLIRISAHVDASFLSASGSSSNLISDLLGLITKYRSEKGSGEVISGLLEALAAIPAAAPEAFKPFLPRVLDLFFAILGEKVDSEDEDQRSNQIEQRTRVTAGFVVLFDSIGAEAVNTERLAVLIAALKENFSLPDYSVRAGSYHCFAVLSKFHKDLIKAEFDSLAVQMAKTLDAEYKIEKKKNKPKVSVLNDNGEEEELEAEENEDEDDEEDGDFNEEDMLGFLPEDAEEFDELNEERHFAVQLYKTFLETYGPEFAPHHEKVFGIIYESGRDYADRVALDVAELFAAMKALFPVETHADLKSGAKTNPNDKDRERAWIAGESLAISDAAANLFDQIRQILFYNIHYGEDPDLVVKSFETLSELTQTYGMAFISDQEAAMKTAKELVKKALKKKLTCQNEVSEDEFGGEAEEDEDEEEGEDEEEEEEEEEADGECTGDECYENDTCGDSQSGESVSDDVSIAAMDFFVVLARVFGPKFQSHFEPMFPVLIKSCSNPDLYGYTFGCFPDIADSMGADKFNSFTSQILPKCLKAVKIPIDEDLARNLAFYLGSTMLKAAGVDSLKQFVSESAEALEKLTNFLAKTLAEEEKEEHKHEQKEGEEEEDESTVAAALDNSVSAIGKLLMVHADTLNSDLCARSLDLFLSSLPLRADFEENQFAFAALVKLIATAGANKTVGAAIEKHAGKLLETMADLLALPADSEKAKEQNLTPKLRGFLGRGASSLSALHKAKFDSLSEERKKAINEAPKQ